MVCVLLQDGFEEAEVVVPVDLLRRGGVKVTLAGVTGTSVLSSHKITVRADQSLSDVDLDEVEMVFVPGGLGGVNGILANEPACDFLKAAVAAEKWMAAICAGPTVLSRLGLMDGKRGVCYPGMENLMSPAIAQPGNRVVSDGKFLTGEAAGSAFDLGLLMLETLKDQETAQKVKESIYYYGG